MPNTLSVTAAVTAPPEGASESPMERYVGRAFLVQYNVILFGGALLFTLAFASFVPLVVGAVGELVWLVIAPRSAAFRRWVDHRSSEDRLARLDSEIAAALASIDASYQTRQLALARESEEITRLLAEQLGAQGPELDVVREKLAELRAAFVRLSSIHERLWRFAAETPASEIEQEILRTREQLAAEKDLAVRVTVRQSLALAERRLTQWEQIGNSRRAVEVQLDTLEKSFSYVRSRTMGLASAAEVHHDIDALLGQARSITALEAETQEATRFSMK